MQSQKIIQDRFSAGRKYGKTISAMLSLTFLLMIWAGPAFVFPAELKAEAGSGNLWETVKSDAFFEGGLTLSRYSVNAEGEVEWVSSLPMLIHPDYIMLHQSDGESIKLFGDFNAESILVRQKQEDFVFLTTNAKAVVMNKQELRQMINMLDSIRGQNSSEQEKETEVRLTETDEQKVIQDYLTQKWIISSANGVGKWHIWVTDEIAISWGLLSENWLSRLAFSSGLPADEWMEKQKLPLRAEFWNGGKLAEILKIEDITPQSMNESRFHIPDGYERINFQQMLFDRMRNR